MSLRCWLAIAFVLGWISPEARSVELAPDDPSVAASLVLWLRDADIDYDPAGGLWSDSSGNGHDAAAVGNVGGVEYLAPTLQTGAGGALTPNELAGVRFAGTADDLLATPPLNGGSGLDELTIIAVYHLTNLAGTSNLTRPLGFGSIAATGANPGNHFNLASDPSIRKDNGSVTGHTAAIPTGAPFIRSARMDAAGIDEWFNADGAIIGALAGGGPAFTTSTDRFYLGDLRAGASPAPGFGSATAPSDFDVVEVLVYTAALTDAQIADINEWLIANLGGAPPPSVTAFSAAPTQIASGESSTLSWQVERSSSVSIAPGVGAVPAGGNADVAPLTTTTYTLTATGDGGITTTQVTVGVDVSAGEPLITEFLASNDNILDDEDCNGSDWIEIHNPNAFAIDIGGYYLSDAPLTPTKWQIPVGTTLEAGGYLVIFASGKDRAVAGAELHTNFNLDRGGETLALVAPDGVTIVSQFAPAYPAQISDIAYGIDETGLTRYLATPTPGAPNGPGFDGQVADTKFNIDRGFYDAPFDVTISSATPGAEIRYTTDGSEPSATHGTVYAAPIHIPTTTVLRAAAFKAGLIPSNVDTQSYLFLDDVIRQPANPPGAPNSWGSRTPDYAMDQRVVDDPAYSGEIIAGLKSIRTLSIVVPNDQFFNNPAGIYANPQNDGRAWEREVSFEFLHPDAPAQDVQTNCGIRIHGNGSRSASGQPKHGFRVEFRGEYGAKRLKYRLFPDIEIDEFDSLILRGQNAHGWTRSSQIGSNVGTSEREQSQYIRDSFARDLMKGMGQTSGEATYVHLYINGLYWGLYNPVEYPRTYYGVSHFGGAEEDYDAINRRTSTTKILDGTFDAWNAMQALADSGLETPQKYAQIAEHIDIDNLIDYMLMHQYMGSRDGPEVFNSNNMRAIRNTRGDAPTRWIGMPWDMEASMFEIDVTRNVNVDDPNTLVRVYTKLRDNPEFRLRYADRVHRHCFNGGTLTPERAEAIWEARAQEIYGAILGESARWGDYRRPAQPFTRDAEWQQERERLLNTYFPTRTAFLVNLLRQNDLYPAIDAPVFNQHGGAVPAGFILTMNPSAGAIYYTLDGSDPRLPGGGINPAASALDGGLSLDRFIELGADGWRYLDTGADLGSGDVVAGHPEFSSGNWKHADFGDGAWSSGQAMLGYGGISGGTINTTVGFGADNTDKFITTYFRKHFDATDAASYTELRLDIRRDDGAVIYLNGHEIARSNIPAGAVSYDTVAASSVGGANESAPNLLTAALAPGVLREGDNVVAVELHQSVATSSDLGLDLQLEGLSIGEGGGIVLDRSLTVRARALDGTEWSALNEATFLVGDLAAPGNLVISEIHYNPPGTSEALEFIELANVSANSLDLSDVHFTGVDFSVPVGTVVAPGGYLLVVHNLAAFEAEYGAGLPVAGEFQNGTALDNSGERLAVLAADGAIIESVRYRDTFPWPTSPDGLGPSLTRISPTSLNDPNEGANWRPSVAAGGSPGSGDAVEFTGDPDSDVDGDGLSALLEHAVGTGPNSPDSPAGLFTITSAGGGGVDISLQRNLAAEDVTFEIQTSADLAIWDAVTERFERLSSTGMGSAIATESYRSSSATIGRFVRVVFSR